MVLLECSRQGFKTPYLPSRLEPEEDRRALKHDAVWCPDRIFHQMPVDRARHGGIDPVSHFLSAWALLGLSSFCGLGQFEFQVDEMAQVRGARLAFEGRKVA